MMQYLCYWWSVKFFIVPAVAQFKRTLFILIGLKSKSYSTKCADRWTDCTSYVGMLAKVQLMLSEGLTGGCGYSINPANCSEEI